MAHGPALRLQKELFPTLPAKSSATQKGHIEGYACGFTFSRHRENKKKRKRNR